MTLIRPVVRPLIRPPVIGRLRAGGAGTDADALTWASAVTAAGGTYSATTLAAMSTFARDAKAAGYWDKLNRINLFAGDQLAAALVPLKVGGGNATDTNVNFVAGDYTEATGLTGDGTTKYLRTGLIPSASLTLNDTHLAVYNRASGVTGAAGASSIGADNGGTSWFAATIPFTDNTLNSAQYDTGGGNLSVASIGTVARGHIVASRTAAASHVIYRNGASAGTNASSGGTLPALECYVFARNSSATPSVYAAAPLGSYSIGSGLSAADVTAYNTHMEAFQDALGRGVI